MRYRFSGCELDVTRHQLLVKGALRPVEPQVFELLRVLVENPGRLVSRDELLATVWRGRIVSESAISARVSAARSAIGDSGTRQAIIQTVPRCGFQLVVPVTTDSRVKQKNPVPSDQAEETMADAQRVRFCTALDGTRIAYATTGTGYPLVRTGHWMTHLEYDWHSPLWRPFLDELGKCFQVTRYDQRGTGLSDWRVKNFSLGHFVEDLEAVTDAAGLQRFALLGTCQGAATAIAYAVRHPKRISHLIIYGGYQRGRLIRNSREARQEGEALLTLIRLQWGKPGGAFTKAFASMFIPDGSPAQIDSLAELQRRTTSAENAATLRETMDRIDVRGLLGRVAVPTLVMHARNDSIQPLEQGRKLAAGIRDAQFVMLESANHVPVAHEPSWEIFFRELCDFVR